MEKITNHKVNIGNPISYLLGDSARLSQYLVCDNIPHGGFSTSFNAALISPLLTPCGFYDNIK